MIYFEKRFTKEDHQMIRPHFIIFNRRWCWCWTYEFISFFVWYFDERFFCRCLERTFNIIDMTAREQCFRIKWNYLFHSFDYSWCFFFVFHFHFSLSYEFHQRKLLVGKCTLKQFYIMLWYNIALFSSLFALVEIASCSSSSFWARGFKIIMFSLDERCSFEIYF